MKLIRCYIENFGKISGMEYYFNTDLNIINEINGWGKTTFAVFIKAMFFGMDSTTKRKVNDNERKKYTPWNGGRYGGFLEFEINQHRYRVERFFGIKDREDIFSLYDLDTNLISDDFTDNLGEEVFKIDKEAFERSTYVPQQQISVETNDSLSAKITNILESDNDINRFESAINRLEDAARIYKKKGDKGKIGELENELRVAQRELSDCISREKPYDEWKGLLNQRMEYKAELEQKLMNIDKDIENIGGAAKNSAIKVHYEELKKDVEAKEEALLPIEDFFINGIPEFDEIAYYEENAKNASRYRLNVTQNMVCDADINEYKKLLEMFNNKIPSEEEISMCEDAMDNASNLDGSKKAYVLTDEENAEFIRLDKIFKGLDNFEEKLDNCNKMYKRYVEIGTDIERENGNLISLESWKDHNVLEEQQGINISKGEVGIGIVGILAIVIGVIFIASVSEVLGAIFIGVGFATIAALFIVYIKSRWVSPEEEKEIVKNEEDILKTRTEINRLNVEKRDIQRKLTTFAERYNKKYSMENMMNILPEISTSYKNYANLFNKKKQNDEKSYEIMAKLNTQIQIIENILGTYADFLNLDYDNDDKSFMRVTGDVSNDGERKIYAEDGVIKKNIGNGVIFKADPNLSGKRFDAWKMSKRMSQDKKWREALRQLKEKKNDFIILGDKISRYEESYNKLQELEPPVAQFISRFYDNCEPKDYEDCLLMIKSRILEVSRLEREYQIARDRLNKFKEENDINGINNEITTTRSIDELQEQRKKLVEQINLIRDDYDAIKAKCSEFGDVVARKPEFEAEVDRLENLLEESKTKYDILNATKLYLEKAKNQFSSRYLHGLNDGFKKYVKLLSGIDNSDISTAVLDTSLNINIEAYGSKKEADYLSTGNKDLLGICARFALVDAMYEVEKPFIILDDPFVNLDEDKIKNALSFLYEVSREYQVIYFACHPSRS